MPVGAVERAHFPVSALERARLTRRGGSVQLAARLKTSTRLVGRARPIRDARWQLKSRHGTVLSDGQNTNINPRSNFSKLNL